MSVAAGAGAVLVIWNGIAPEGEAEYYRWHDREHIPERLSIPGYRRGRRLIHTTRPRDYLTLYETDGTHVFRSAAYRSQLAYPTPWSQAISRHFRGMVRQVFRIVLASGRGEGGILLAVRLALRPAQPAAFVDRTRDVLLELAETAGVVAARVLAHEPHTTRAIHGQADDGGPDASPPWLVLVECGAPGIADAVARGALAPDRLAAAGAVGPLSLDTYQLQISMDA